MSSLNEIAALLGLSKSTVSRALSGQPGISSATVDAVRDLAAELGYSPSAHAVALATGKNHAIGVVLPSVERWFYTSVLTGIDAELAQAGYDVVIYDLSHRREGVRQRLETEFLERRVDAIIVVSTEFTPDEWTQIIALGKPLINVGAPTPGVRRIGVDEYQVGRVVAEHIVNRGHTEIAYMGGFDPQALVTTSVNDRERAFRDVLNERAILLRNDWVLSGEYRMSTAKLAMQRLLQDGHRPTALVSASDEMAIGAMYAIAEAGLRVGADIALVGIDGHEYSEAFGLATAEQYPEEQGGLAARTLLAELNGAPTTTTIVPSRWTFVERSSLGPVR